MTNTGWICPRCGNVYAPFWFSCDKCNQENKSKQSLPSMHDECDHDWKIWNVSNLKAEHRCQKCGEIK